MAKPPVNKKRLNARQRVLQRLHRQLEGTTDRIEQRQLRRDIETARQGCPHVENPKRPGYCKICRKRIPK
jgi:hypothetical protein